jgi:hypothetical protein
MPSKKAGGDERMHLHYGMVQAWVGHFVTPLNLKCTYDEYD